MMTAQSILVIDDESSICELVAATASAMGIPCTTTTDADTFLGCLSPDITLILIDLIMPKMDGVELLRLLAQRQCKAGIVLVSGTGNRVIETAAELTQSLGLSIIGHLNKHFRITELEAVLQLQALPAAPPVVNETSEPIPQDEELYRAIRQDEFILYYQPQIDIATTNVSGVEALVRWQHPERGIIFPDYFVDRLESLGLIDQLGWLTAERAMSEMAQFADDYDSALVLSLNASVHSLKDLKFPDKFISLAEKHGIAAGNLTIEITESGFIEELSRTLDVLTRLRMKNVKPSIDDFGTGFSMMQQLRTVPATELKIDKTFVQNMHLNDRDRVMVEKTIEIGHELGMRVVGEGVETQKQVDFLRTHNCDALQGYLFSRPLPLPQMSTWLKNYHASDFFSMAGQPRRAFRAFHHA